MFYALILVLVWVGFKYLVTPMMPFIIAFFVAALLQIPVRKLKIPPKRKKLASIVSCVIFYGILFLLAAWAGLKLLDGLENLIRKVPYLYNTTVFRCSRRFLNTWRNPWTMCILLWPIPLKILLMK